MRPETSLASHLPPRASAVLSIALGASLLVLVGSSAHAQECGPPSASVWVSNLCVVAAPDGTRERPFPSIDAALVAVNDPANPDQHVRVVLLPTAPGVPLGPATIDTPGRCVTLESEGGPSVTACAALTIAANRPRVTLRGIYFATPGGAAVVAPAGSPVRIDNCVFHGCQVGIDAYASGSRVDVRHSVFVGCELSLRFYQGEAHTIVNTIFARETGDVVRFRFNDSQGANVTFDYCAFCENARFEPQRSQVRNSRTCPANRRIFVDPDAANFRLHPDSGLFHVGHPGREFQDPDGTRATLGAFGGPWARPYTGLAATGDAEILDVLIEPEPGTGLLRVRARVRTAR